MLPNGNFLCVVPMIDLWLDVMVEVFTFNLKEKISCHRTMGVSNDLGGEMGLGYCFSFEEDLL